MSDRLKIKRPPSIVEQREEKLDELNLDEFFKKVRAERAYQDEKWGGPDFDDTHDHPDWATWIAEYANASSVRAARHDFKTRMVKVAALAAAAYQAEKRREDSSLEVG